jgi:hypothetical protein
MLHAKSPKKEGNKKKMLPGEGSKWKGNTENIHVSSAYAVSSGVCING